MYFNKNIDFLRGFIEVNIEFASTSDAKYFSVNIHVLMCNIELILYK